MKKRIRKRHDLQIVVNDFIEKKLNSFNQFQFVFNRAFFLMHFDFKRDFFIDIDVFKKKFRRDNLSHQKCQRFRKHQNVVVKNEFSIDYVFK